MDYNELLDLTLEIEGLILLRLNRGESVPDASEALLRRKVADLHRLTMTDPEPSCCQSPSDDAAIADSAVMEETEDADLNPQAVTAEHQEILAEDTAAENPEEAVEEFTGRAIEEAAATAPTVADSLAIEEPRLNEAVMASVGDVTKVFTLNDKFRFRRELFRNSDLEFTETLNVLQAMSSLDEAEDYLYNDLAWDPESDDVKDFVKLIAPCYRS